MNATIFCSNKINRVNEDDIMVSGFNNIFNVPFFPTLFSFSLAAVISGIDRSIDNNFEIRLSDRDTILETIGGGFIPKDPMGHDFISTTITLDIQNTTIPKSGSYSIDLLVNNEVAGETIVDFITKAS